MAQPRRLLVWTGLFLLAAFWHQPATPQVVTGSVEGQLLDEDGRPLSDAEISLSGRSLQGTRTTTSDANGRFRVLALPIGTYTIGMTHEGYRPVHVEQVQVRLGQTSDLGAIAMEPESALTERVVVEAKRPLIDPQSTVVGGNLGANEFESLPIERNYREMSVLLPHVNPSFLGDGVNFAGGTGLDNRYFIDGAEVTDPFRGVTGTNLPYNFIEEVQVRTGGYQAEYRSSIGGMIDVVTHSGSNEFHGSLFGFFLNDRSSGEPKLGAFEPATGDFAQYDVGFGLGGPIVRDELWFFVAYDASIENEDVEVPGIGFLPDESTRRGFAGKLSWQAGSNHRLVFTAFGDPTSRRGVRASFFQAGIPAAVENPDPVLRDIEVGSVNFSYRGTHNLGPRVLIESHASQTRRKDVWLPATEVGRNEPFFNDTTTQTWSGGCVEAVDDRSVQTTFGVDVTHLVAGHALKAGVAYRENRLDLSHDVSAVWRFSPNAFPPYEYMVWEEVKAGEVRNRIPSVYVQDSWRVTERFHVDLGLRWDGQSVTAPDGRKALEIDDQWQPRAGFVYLLGQRGGQRVFGSLGRFYHELATWSLSWLLIGQGPVITYYVQDPRDDPSGGLVDPPKVRQATDDIEGQHHDEYTLGYERRVGGSSRVGIRGIYRTLREAIEDGQDPETEEVFWGNPGRDALAAFPRVRREYRALELTYRKAGPRFALLSSYVWSKTDGNYPGLFNSDFDYPFPNSNYSFDRVETLVNGAGRLPNDRPHVFKASGFYRFGIGLTAGASLFWGSGTPLNDYGQLPPPNNLFYEFLVPRGTEGRTPSIWDLSLRLAYDAFASAGSRWRPKLILDLLHVGSREEPVDFDQVGYLDGGEPNPTFMVPTAYQPPTAVRLGFEVAF